MNGRETLLYLCDQEDTKIGRKKKKKRMICFPFVNSLFDKQPNQFYKLC